MDNYVEIIGYIAGICTTICLIPQLWKIYKTSSAEDVSILTFLVLFCGQALWITYGVLLYDLIVDRAHLVNSELVSTSQPS